MSCFGEIIECSERKFKSKKSISVPTLCTFECICFPELIYDLPSHPSFQDPPTQLQYSPTSVKDDCMVQLEFILLLTWQAGPCYLVAIIPGFTWATFGKGMVPTWVHNVDRDSSPFLDSFWSCAHVQATISVQNSYCLFLELQGQLSRLPLLDWDRDGHCGSGTHIPKRVLPTHPSLHEYLTVDPK